MAKKDLLPDLINSLSVNEKRYFSLFSSISPGEQNFKKLFNALNGETAYDSKRIGQKLGNTRMNIAYEKAYLQKVLLKSLRNFNDDASVEIALHNTLIEVEVLYNKQQYDLALGLIKKSIPDAEKKDLYLLQLLLIRWEQRCMLRMGQYDYLEKQYTRGVKKEQQLMSLAENISHYRALHSYMFAMINRKGNVTRASDRKKLAEIKRHPLMKSPALAKSFYAKLSYYEILIAWYHHRYELKKAYTCTKQVLRLFEQDSFRIKQNPQAYYSFLSNFFNRALSIDNMEEAAVTLDKIGSLILEYHDVLPLSQRKEMTSTLTERKLILLTFTFEYKKAVALAEAIIQEIEKPKSGYRQGFLITIYFFAALNYFHLKNFERALAFQRKIIDQFDYKVRLDFVFMTHVLHFITHLELKHFDMLPHLLRAIQRFIKTQDLQNKANNMLLVFFNELIKTNGNTHLTKEVIRKYQPLFLPYKNDPTQNVVLETLDLYKWIEGKGGI